MRTNRLASGLPTTVWLASKSPRRKALLESLGVTVHVILAQSPEAAEALEIALPDEAPLPYVQRVTHLKLESAKKTPTAQHLRGWLLSADTTVELNEHILGKPNTPDEALQMLRQLQNQTHLVHTSVAASFLDGQTAPSQAPTWQLTQTSLVTFGDIPESFMLEYIAQGTPFDKAGGYGIQSEISQFIRSISGSYSGIMGLPLYETNQLLKQQVNA